MNDLNTIIFHIYYNVQENKSIPYLQRNIDFLVLLLCQHPVLKATNKLLVPIAMQSVGAT